MNMEKYFMWIHYERLYNHNKAKHNKTVCILLGIYCITGADVNNSKLTNAMITLLLRQYEIKWLYYLQYVVIGGMIQGI